MLGGVSALDPRGNQTRLYKDLFQIVFKYSALQNRCKIFVHTRGDVQKEKVEVNTFWGCCAYTFQFEIITFIYTTNHPRRKINQSNITRAMTDMSYKRETDHSVYIHDLIFSKNKFVKGIGHYR